MKKTAFLFPGQGSQSVGMGRDIYADHAAAREIFAAAGRIAGVDIAGLCFDGPMEALTETVNLQPAVTAVSLGFLTLLEEAGIRPDVTAGHSLGEYGALRAAGALTTEQTLRAVTRRGALMHRESQVHQGAMRAVVGLPMDAVAALVAEAAAAGDGPVSVANHNAETQIVITGAPAAVARAGALAAERGGKAIALKVSGAWHSELMKGAEADLAAFLAGLDFKRPDRELIFNVTADAEADPDAIRALMARQLRSPVRWHEIMIRMVAMEVRVFAEVGPGKVLAGLLKKSLPKGYEHAIFNINSRESLAAFIDQAR